MAERTGARHAVLIHGAWQGSWSFAAWAPMLAAHGWQVHAVDLPGNGWGARGQAPASLDAYVAEVARVVLSIPAPVIVVGHSGGGITASQVAEELADRVAGVVYLAGMMLPSGMPYAELAAGVSASEPQANLAGLAGITPWLDWNADRSATTVRTEGALRCFLQDCEPGAARAAAALLRAQPEAGRAICNRLTAERFGTVARVYVECRGDRSVVLPVQRRMQQLSPGATVLPMDCGHVPQWVQPERLTSLLVPEFESLLGQHLERIPFSVASSSLSSSIPSSPLHP